MPKAEAFFMVDANDITWAKLRSAVTIRIGLVQSVWRMLTSSGCVQRTLFTPKFRELLRTPASFVWGSEPFFAFLVEVPLPRVTLWLHNIFPPCCISSQNGSHSHHAVFMAQFSANLELSRNLHTERKGSNSVTAPTVRLLYLGSSSFSKSTRKICLIIFWKNFTYLKLHLFPSKKHLKWTAKLKLGSKVDVYQFS